MVFEIDGHDILPYIDFEGLSFSISDLDSEETSRNLDGDLMRFRVASKVRWDVPCRPLTTSEAMQIFEWIKPEFFQLRATDLYHGGVRAGTFYSNNNKLAVKISSTVIDDEIYWTGLQFPVIER